MLTTRQATALLHKGNRDQRKRLQPAYNVASARLDRTWTARRKETDGAYKSLLALAQSPNANRDRVRASREYADYKGEFQQAAQRFTSTIKAVATNLESDGQRNGATFAYNAIAAQGERPQRVDTSRIARFTEGVAFLAVLAGFARGLTDGLDSQWQQADKGGYSATWAVKQMREWSYSVPVTAALNSGRTAQLFGARRATLDVYRGNGVDKWIWSASLDSLVCAFCLSMHGSVHSVDESMDTHHNCRCAEIPVTPSWGDLGFGDGTDFTVETGDAWLKEQPYDVWERILGKAGAAAYADGAFALPDVQGTYTDPVFGVMGREKSLNEILGEQLATVYKRRIA